MRKTVIVMVAIVVGMIGSGCGSDSNSSSGGSNNACDNLVMDCSKCTDDLAKQDCTALVSGLRDRNNSDECKKYNDLWTKGEYGGSTLCQ